MSNSRVLEMRKPDSPATMPVNTGVLQRKCDCGQHTFGGGECAWCSQKSELPLQRSAITQHEHSDAKALPPISQYGVVSLSPLVGKASTGSRVSRDFSQIRVSAAQAGIPQAHLAIGKPGDRFEREADRVADQVMQTANAGVESRTTTSSETGSLRRAADETEAPPPPAGAEQKEGAAKAEPEEEEAESKAQHVATMLLESDNLEDGTGASASPGHSNTPPQTEPVNQEPVQARELPGQTPAVSSTEEFGIASLRGGGQPLSPSSRAFFESRFGHDFSHVRIHTGPAVGELAQAVQAKAFTVGRDVVFGQGHYQPESRSGQWLIAHELAHVVQQQPGLSRSPAGSIKVQQTGQTKLQGGFFGKLWSGIKKGASAVWSGIKKGASAVWRGTKWVAGKVWKGIKAVAGWGWNVLKSGAALAWDQVIKFPGRVARLIAHLGSGIAGVAKWLWEGLKLAWHLNFKGMGKWLLDGFLSGAAWVGRLIGKLADIAGLGEVWDLVSQIIKFNTRSLTSGEKSEAQKTFKNSISYWQVRVDEYSLIAKIGAAFKGGGGMGVTTFHTVNFNQKITASPGSNDMHWLTHELTHVSQYEHVGSQYLGEAIHAQATTGYDYKGSNALFRPASHVNPNLAGKHFSQFNREQQGDIAADYYFSLFGNSVHSDSLGWFVPVTSDYDPVVDELRAGNI